MHAQLPLRLHLQRQSNHFWLPDTDSHSCQMANGCTANEISFGCPTKTIQELPTWFWRARRLLWSLLLYMMMEWSCYGPEFYSPSFDCGRLFVVHSSGIYEFLSTSVGPGRAMCATKCINNRETNFKSGIAQNTKKKECWNLCPRIFRVSFFLLLFWAEIEAKVGVNIETICTAHSGRNTSNWEKCGYVSLQDNINKKKHLAQTIAIFV